MSITYDIRSEGDILYVIASGKDDSLEEVIAYNKAILEAAITSNVHKVLCDERNLEYAIGTLDTFEVATFAAHTVRGIGKVALVINKAQQHDANFWETVVINRGLQARVFPAVEDAKHWLDNDSA